MLNKKLKLQRCHGLPFPRALLRHRREGILNGDLKSKSECIQSLSWSFKGKHACPLWVIFARAGVDFGEAACPLTPEIGRHPASCAERHELTLRPAKDWSPAELEFYARLNRNA
jgi:hypothetical protein